MGLWRFLSKSFNVTEHNRSSAARGWDDLALELIIGLFEDFYEHIIFWEFS